MANLRDRLTKWWTGADPEAKVAEKARGSALDHMYNSGGDDGEDSLQCMRDQLSLHSELMQRYKDYEDMDDYPVLSGALDVYADGATVPDSLRGKTIWGKSKDKLVRDLIDDLLHRRIRIEDDIWVAVRSLCKYGSLYAENVITDIGVVGLNWLPAPSMRRLETPKGGLIGFVQDLSCEFSFKFSEGMSLNDLKDNEDTKHLTFFAPWEVTHWRLRRRNIRSMYGESILDGARWIWKRLVLLEDSAMVYMLERSPSRYAFYIDTGDLPPDQAAALVNKVRRRYKKKKLIDPTTGKLDLRINPLNSSEDFWVPTRGGKESTRIDTITGPSYDNIENVEYFQNKLMSALGIPRSYLGMESEAQKGSLAQEDVIFARTEMRIQREFRNGIKKIVRLHLAALNIDPDSVEWEVEMSPPSAIFELQQIEVMNAQAALAETLEAYYPKWWLLQRVFHHTDEEAAFISAEAFAERDAEMKKNAETQADIIAKFPEVAAAEVVPDEQVEEKKVDMDKKLARLTTLLERNRENGEDIKRRLKKIGPDMLRKMRRRA